eukprot:5243196-Pleurochrysis_carterae.AAC.3
MRQTTPSVVHVQSPALLAANRRAVRFELGRSTQPLQLLFAHQTIEASEKVLLLREGEHGAAVGRSDAKRQPQPIELACMKAQIHCLRFE